MRSHLLLDNELGLASMVVLGVGVGVGLLECMEVEVSSICTGWRSRDGGVI